MKKKLPVEFYSPLLFSIIKSCCFSVERIWIFKGTITKTGIQKAATEKIKKTDSAFNSGEKVFSIIENRKVGLYSIHLCQKYHPFIKYRFDNDAQ